VTIEELGCVAALDDDLMDAQLAADMKWKCGGSATSLKKSNTNFPRQPKLRKAYRHSDF
jgi:hypothetical protein